MIRYIIKNDWISFVTIVVTAQLLTTAGIYLIKWIAI